MKNITTTVALAFVVSIAVECQAQRPNRGGQRQRPQGQQDQRQGPQGQQRQRQRPLGQQGQRQRGQRPGAGDPSQMATQMMAEFDKNGDKKLDRSELTAMFASIRERRAQGAPENAQGRRGPAGRGTAEGRPGRNSGRQGGRNDRRGNDADDAGGGVKPKRPPAGVDAGQG